MPRPGENKARRREVVVLPQDEVGSEVASRPRFEQGRRVGTELDKELAQLSTLECVKLDLRHVAGL